MFGYVTASTEKLTPEENSIYRGAYCGLCRTLGKRYGTASRMTINYDMTFLALLLSSVYGIGFEEDAERCPVHLTKRVRILYNEITEYAADMNIALTRMSALDKWDDEKNVAALAAARAMKGQYRLVSSKYPRQCSAMEQNLGRLSEIERTGATNIDEAADCFGRILSEVFIWQEDAMSERLRAFGHALGRAVYIMDAAVDLKSDLKHKRYNPLVFAETTDQRELICILLGVCDDKYRALELKSNAGIFENIIYSGIWTRFDAAEKRKAVRSGSKSL